ncbi:MAG: GPW/gp25 family protein [Paracoccus sp. (in: a-proteobacteria)]|uniref:GPW/gp25 family protein n=1 Tax=Paracoccus sp. TaxID=267 RepID=UPI0026E038FA|nr:GPW/gp25 family protein [Paracoccus sp. (in: a-proteobacteria)]MDO5622770.1 GPW/gp25 family protein [Paracoccus sp. (in: a-proteobacteria)]
MSLMHVFRDSAARRDSREVASQLTDGERDLTMRSQKRREGVSEAALRHDLAVDIASLMNTIRLDVVINLHDTPYVQKSVVNFGFQDMDGLWHSSRTPGDMAQAIRSALIRNEPRLRSETVEVHVTSSGPGVDQRLTFEILAEMIANPTDIPLQFLAEVDPAAGKIAMTRMKGEP